MIFLFEVSAFNELDHFTPVAEQLLILGNEVNFVLGDDPRLSVDNRLRYLQKWKGFHATNSAEFSTRVRGQFFVQLSRLFFGRFSRIFGSNSTKLKLLTWLSTIVGIYRPHRKLLWDCAISGWGDPSSLMMTSTLARRKVIVALPHGYPCVKNEDFNPHIRAIQATGKRPDFSLRNCFAAYVVATERNRELLVGWGMSEKTLKVWGNARFCPDWTNKLIKILPATPAWSQSRDRQRVLILLPASTSGFDHGALTSLLRRLASSNFFLSIKPHTREYGHGSLIPDDLVRNPNVEVAERDNTLMLISSADTVLNFATGAAIDALFLGKRLIFLRYLTSNSLSWDDCKAIKVAHNEDEVINLVSDRTWSLDNSTIESYLQNEVFANGSVTNPPLYYATELSKLTLSAMR